MEIPSIYLRNDVSAITNYEAHNLENILPADTVKIDAIASQQKERRQTFDVELLSQVHQITQQQEQRILWLEFLTTSICIVIIIGILCFTLYSHCHKLRCYSLSNTSEPEPSPQTPASPYECNQRDKSEQSCSDTSRQDVLFTAYAMHAAK